MNSRNYNTIQYNTLCVIKKVLCEQIDIGQNRNWQNFIQQTIEFIVTLRAAELLNGLSFLSLYYDLIGMTYF